MAHGTILQTIFKKEGMAVSKPTEGGTFEKQLIWLLIFDRCTKAPRTLQLPLIRAVYYALTKAS